MLAASSRKTENWEPRTALGSGDYQVQGAWVLVSRVGAEGVQVVGQVGEGELDLVAAAEAGADFVQQAVVACDQDCAGIRAHIRTERSGVAKEFNAAGYGARSKVIDEDAGVTGGDNVELRAVRGGEEIDRLY